ncbi:MAG: LLM class flavin-dependent oxidoreductase [Actinomycetota bacterium]
MKIRVGFGFGTTAAGDLDGTRWLELIDACEELGWDSVWFSERITLGVPDPLALMAAVAARTSRLKFGPSVLVLPGRNPVLLAKELATIDQLSGGRLVVAFGLGAPSPSEHELFMVPRGERAARTDEAVALIKRLWTEDTVTHEGPFFPVRGLTLRPKPVQQPHPDVWFGGHSQPALRRTGRLGDGWLPSFVTPEEYKAKADVVREAASDHGREFDEEHFGALVGYVPEGAEQQAGPIVEAFASRRPDVAAEDVIVMDGHRGLDERLEEFIHQGASKFVVVPLVPPGDWRTELATLRRAVAEPMEN